MNRLLFLDFDGVLHPNFSQDEEFFCRADRLLEVLAAESATVDVIISSSWRFQWPWQELLDRIPGELSRRVTDATPEVAPGRHQRYREIRAYLDRRHRSVDWRALDDSAGEFPEGCVELIACNGRTGFDEGCATLLRNWLAQPSAR